MLETNPFNTDIQQGVEWHKERSRGIGGSEISCIMGNNPWKSKLELWQEKTGQKEPEDISGQYQIQRGHAYEPVARVIAEEKYETKFPPKNVQHPDYSFVRASLDGYSQERGWVFEAKVPLKASKTILMARDGELPQHYIDQAQWNMLAAQCDTCIFMVYDAESQTSYFKSIIADKDYQAKLLHEAKVFWSSVENNTPPITLDVGEAAALDDAEELKQAKLALDDAEARYEKIKDRFKERLMASGDDILCFGGVTVTKTMRKGSVDYGKIPVLKGMNLDIYRKPDVEVYKVEIL